ncbi:MAG: penicillin-binding protein 2 [Lachnospiraceae bacterium]|nr:penicillin-binding protein 2 [Lachnospiraceae bacterium]
MKEKSKNKRRKALIGKPYIIVSYLFFGMFLGMIGYMIYFKVCKSDTFANNLYNKRQNKYEKNIVRGSILASNGTVLARTDSDKEGKEFRVYPYNNLFAQVVGYCDHGSSGLEASENYTLRSSHVDILEKLQNNFWDKKNKGDNLVTSLDIRLQQAASNAIGYNRGAVIVMNTKTGKVLADVSKPDFNPNTIARNWELLNKEESGSPFLNRALQGQYPPGSTFKIVTSLAYLRKYGTFDNFFFNCSGKYTQGGYTIHCNENIAHRKENFADAFANSCNCAFSNIATQLLDKNSLESTANALHFNESFPIGLLSVKSFFALENSTADGLTMQTSIGQGNTLISPVHMAMIVGAVANGGRMMEPSFVKQVEVYNGTIVKQIAPKSLGQVMTPEEAYQLTELMKGVVQRGTATDDLSSFPYDIAGKTGTAEYGSKEKGTAHSWFVGFSNTGNSDIVVAVIVENGGDKSHPATLVARSIFETYFS